MAIIDIQIIPVGTTTPSVSGYVAQVQQLLVQYKKKNIIENYVLTPMNTQIQGELDQLLQVVLTLHNLPFEQGVHRVCTNIRIDDRHDKPLTMSEKIAAVKNKMQV